MLEDTPTDVAACCKDPNKAKCLSIKGKSFCPVSEVYNAAKANAECVADPCNNADATDRGNCCTAPATCSTIANTALLRGRQEALRQQQGQQLL